MARTYLGHGEGDGHGHTDEEGGQHDLGEEALGVPLGAVEAFYDEAVELAQAEPPALQLDAALSLQDARFWGRGVLGVPWRREKDMTPCVSLGVVSWRSLGHAVHEPFTWIHC